MADSGTALSAAQNLFSAIQSRELREVFSFYGYQSRLNELQHIVSTVIIVLRDATERELCHQDQDLMEKLKDAVFEADDLFGKLVGLVEQKQLLGADDSIRKKLKNFFSSSKNTISLLRTISLLVKKIRNRLDLMGDNIKQFSFQIDPEPTRNTDSGEDPSQNGSSEECALISITPPEQTPNQESYPIPTPESNIPRQLSYNDNERLIRSLPRKIKRIICGVIFNKWLYRLLNVILEISQVTFTEVNDRQKISDFLCYKLVFIISSICLLISLGEFIAEVKRSRVVYQRRGICCWFYYPGFNGRLFGSLPLYFSVISSATQFCVNLAIFLSKKRFFNADCTALLFAMVALISPMIQ